MPSLASHFRLERSGAPAYDVWMHSGDSGAVFAAGTTDAVAEIVQGGIECADRASKLALRDAISGWRGASAKKKAATTTAGAQEGSAPKKRATSKRGSTRRGG